MKQPWIPAPCKATAKRFSKGKLLPRRRRVSFLSPKYSDRDDGRVYVGHSDRFLDSVSAICPGDDFGKILDNRSEDGESRLLINLRHIQLLYSEARDQIEALKQESDTFKDELLRLRLECDTEKDSRRSAEMRVETLSMTVRELEKVVDAQKDYIRELRFEQRLKPQVAPIRSTISKKNVDSDSNGQNGGIAASKSTGQKQSTGTMTTTKAVSNAGVQTVRIVQNQSVQTKAVADRHAQTATVLVESDVDTLREELESERQLVRLLQAEINEIEKKIKVSNENRGIESERNEKRREPLKSIGGSMNREDLKEILSTLHQLETEVGDLRKRVRQQKLINLALKQCFRTLESSYATLFS